MTTNIVSVSAEEHKNLKIKNDAGISFSENIHIIPIVVSEFADVAANFPIVFIKDENSDRLRVAAMLGMEVGKNLFFEDGAWQATHVPLNIGRVPFSFAPLGDTKTLGAAIDLNHPLVSEDEGTPLFDENGEATDYYKWVNNFLNSVFQGEMVTQKFGEAMAKHDLLREFHLQIEDESGAKSELVGLFTPSASLLQKLSDEATLELNKEGFLAAIHIAIQSLSQIKRLVQLNNKRDGTNIRGVNIKMIGDEQPIVK